MDLKLFLSTFALIFLAELGDKTQLASMAASAGTKSLWSVFGGAASALVLSTLVAVLAGSFIQRVVPAHYVKGTAAILFLFFGVLLLFNALQLRKEAHVGKTTAPITAPKGILARVALSAAAQFERGSAEHYRELSSQSKEPSMRELFAHLAEEEESHLAKISTINEHVTLQSIPEHPAPSVAKAGPDQSSATIIESAIAHEKSTAQFYRALADSAVIPEIRTAFWFLSAEEESHVAHLEEFRETGDTDISKKH